MGRPSSVRHRGPGKKRTARCLWGQTHVSCGQARGLEIRKKVLGGGGGEKCEDVCGLLELAVESSHFGRSDGG